MRVGKVAAPRDLCARCPAPQHAHVTGGTPAERPGRRLAKPC